MMTLKQISGLGRRLLKFLGLFADCFGRSAGIKLLQVYVKGQLSDLHRKTAEAIALRFGTAPRTLQRFLESIKWDEEKLRDRCQQIVAKDHAHPEAVIILDEQGTAKSGKNTVGVNPQWCGNTQKVENCVVAVHLAYASPGFDCLLDSALYLPEDWANDFERRKKTTFPTTLCSVPNRKLQWSSSIEFSKTESKQVLGHSTSFMGAMAFFWTLWRTADKYSLRKYRSTSTVGCTSRKSYAKGRKRDVAVIKRHIPVWHAAVLRAKFGIC